MSLTSVLLPEPETPVTTVKAPMGNSTVRFLRLFCRAPLITSSLRPARRVSGTGTSRAPVRYWPVSDAGTFSIGFGVPWATTSPP
jgi:hypothetical protein